MIVTSVAIGLDGARRECFAVIETRDHDGAPMKSFYGTLAPRPSLSMEENPVGLGLELYPEPPTIVFSAFVDGRGLGGLRRALAEPPSDRRRDSRKDRPKVP